MIIREECQKDHVRIFDLNQAAFERRAEADLVNRLRANGKASVSLVAEFEEKIVGHILFSPVTLSNPHGTATGYGLAPMAISPAFQRQGIGGSLVREGLAKLRKLGAAFVVVLGHPKYYPRFGFQRASIYGVKWEIDCPDEVFMALEFKPGGIPADGGTIAFAPEFAGV